MILILAGFLSGILSGMGVGGGTVLIPALTFFTQMSQKQIQGINLIYFIPSAVSAIYFHNKNKMIETDAVKKIVVFAVVGCVVGAFIAVNMDDEILRKIFSVFLFIMGINEILKRDKRK